MERIDPEAISIAAASLSLADQPDRVAAIQVPTLVLVGDQDTVTPPALSQQLSDAIPGARLHILAGAGHLANIERPADFNRLLEELIGPLG